MKKVIIFIVALLMVAPCATVAADKTLEKALKKEYKEKKKEYKKKNWEIFGSSRTLDVALLLHYDKLNNGGENVHEVVGVVSSFVSKNIGKQQAINNACVTYAGQAGSHVKGRVVSDAGSVVNVPQSEFDKFYAAYERLVEKEIRGEMKESYTIIRDKKDGTFEMQSFFIIDEDAATQARIRAFENAAKESEMAQKYATQVSDFIKEGFDTQGK